MNIKIIILVVVVGLIIVSCSHLFNKKPKEQVIEKYGEYKYLSEITQTEKYEIIKFHDKFTGVSPSPPFFDKNNNVIFEVRNNDVDERDFTITYYRLDGRGAIIDTFLVDDYTQYEGYFINKDGYITWLIDGDKTKKAYKSINRLPEYNPQSLKKIFADYYDNSTIVKYYDDHFESPVTDNEEIDKNISTLFFDGTNDQWYRTQIYKALFFRDGQWYSLDSDWRYIEDYWEKDDHRYYGTSMKKQTLESSFDEDKGITQLKTEFFHPVGFIREDYHRRRSASPFSPTGGFGSPNYWNGTGFIDIILNGDTLKIKKRMVELSAMNGSYTFSPPPYLQLFYDEKVNFFIILWDSDFYLIRPKN